MATVGRKTPPRPRGGTPAGGRGRRRWLWIAGGAAGLIALLVLPRLMPGTYQLHLLNMAGIYVIAVLGLNFIFGWTGQISLGHAALWGLGAYASALPHDTAGLALRRRSGRGHRPDRACSACVVGIPTLRLRGHYLAMATVGVAEIVRIVLVNWEP